MKTTKKNQLIILLIMTFFLFVSKSFGQLTIKFYDKAAVEEHDSLNYLVKNDGTKIYGKLIDYNNQEISIDDKKFAFPEIRAIKNEDIYYGKVDRHFAKRVVQGKKINIYNDNFITTITTNRGASGTTSNSYDNVHIYYELENSGNLILLTYMKDLQELKELLKDCPKAMERLNKTPKEIRKTVNFDPFYINDTVKIYNNDCQ
jgi:hypothetical protein